jgi:hypothetical protein
MNNEKPIYFEVSVKIINKIFVVKILKIWNHSCDNKDYFYLISNINSLLVLLDLFSRQEAHIFFDADSIKHIESKECTMSNEQNEADALESQEDDELDYELDDDDDDDDDELDYELDDDTDPNDIDTSEELDTEVDFDDDFDFDDDDYQD